MEYGKGFGMVYGMEFGMVTRAGMATRAGMVTGAGAEACTNYPLWLSHNNIAKIEKVKNKGEKGKYWRGGIALLTREVRRRVEKMPRQLQ